MLRIPHCLDNRLTDGDEVVSPTHRPRSTPQKHFSVSDTHFCQRLSEPQSPDTGSSTFPGTDANAEPIKGSFRTQGLDSSRQGPLRRSAGCWVYRSSRRGRRDQSRLLTSPWSLDSKVTTFHPPVRTSGSTKWMGATHAQTR
jgi:hypothetical protein